MWGDCRVSRIKSAALLSPLAMLAAMPAAAQSNAGPASSATAVADDRSDEIVVTARRREEALQDVPASVFVTGQEQMFITGDNSMTGLRDAISNVNFGSDLGTRSRVNIRGLGSDRSGNQANGVGFFIDGIYQNGTGRLNAPFLDIERIEVLKGPQGARYGRNAYAGVVNIVTVKPGNDLRATLQTELENHGGREFSVSVSGPLVTDRLFGKVAYYNGRSDGDFQHAVTGRDMAQTKNEFLDLRLIWQASDQLEFDLKYGHGELRGPGYAYSQVASLQKLSENFVMDDNQTAGLDFDEFNLGAAWRSDSVEIINRLGYFESESFYDIDADFSALDVVRATSRTRNRNWTNELRIQSAGDGPFNWLVGGEIVKVKNRNLSTSTLRPGLCAVIGIPAATCPYPRTSTGRGRGNSDIWSIFGELSYEFAERLEVTLSARYDDIKVTSNLPAPQQVFRDKALQPLLSLRYKLDDDHSIYASAARGIRQGGFNPVTVKAQFRPFKSDDVITYEAGYRGSFPSIGGHFNISAFYSDVRDMNHYIGLPPAPGFTIFPGVFSLGKARSFGAEVDLGLDITDTLSWTASGGWVDCKLKDVPVLTGPDYNAVPLNLKSGKQCVDSSEWTFSTSLAGEWDIGSRGWQALGSLALSGRGDTLLVYDAGTPSSLPRPQRTFRRSEEVQGPVYLLDASVGLRKGGLSLLVYGENLTNELYATQNTSADWLRDFGMIWISDNQFRVNLGPRRRIGIRARYEF